MYDERRREMESLGHIAVVKEYKRKKVDTREYIPWSEFEFLLQDLLKALNARSRAEVLKLVGYSGATHLTTWRKKNLAPVLAKHAVLGLLSELGATREAIKQPVEKQFSLVSLTELLTIIAGSNNLSAETKKRWIHTLAQEIAYASEA